MALGGLLPDTTIVHIGIVIVATGVIWIGSGWLEDGAETIARYHGLPAVIQGSIVIAIGSSFPELSSVVFAALVGAFDLGVGAIVGSAIFNVLVIPAVAAIATENPLASSRTLVYKEAQFYMIAVAALIITLALAVIYFPIPGPTLSGRLTRALALLPLALYGLYIFIQWQDFGDSSEPIQQEGVRIRREWVRLGLGLLLILVAVEQLVGAVEGLNHTFGIPEFLGGVSILAAATSLPDTLVSVRAAREGRAVTSLGNVLGSNTFDLLVAIPVGVLIAGSAPVNFAVAIPMLGVLTVATILLFAMLRTDLELSDLESYFLLGAYAVFIVWVIAETIGLTDLIRGI
ncbi:MAG: sodium:calcium antiporter [Salinirussus sp.]